MGFSVSRSSSERSFAGVLLASLLLIFNAGLIAKAVTLERDLPLIQNDNVRLIFPSDSAPTHIIIPSLNISAKVESVGINRKGDMGIPKDPLNAAWLNVAANPGELGTMVIDGHLETRSGAPAIFFDLKKLETGANVYVKDEQGSAFLYRVINKKIFSYDTADTSEIFENKDGFFLNLITCTGDWIPQEKLFDQRLVVFTELVARNISLPSGFVNQ